jgi:hypothetical protein
MDADGAVFCGTCNAPVDEVEEVNGSLICLACGGALDGGAPMLVDARAAARRGPDDPPPGEGYGVVVAAHDSGAVAGAAGAPGHGGAGGAIQAGSAMRSAPHASGLEPWVTRGSARGVLSPPGSEGAVGGEPTNRGRPQPPLGPPSGPPHPPGAILRGRASAPPGAGSRSRAPDLRPQLAALSAGVTAAGLPPAVARDASELLRLVANAYSEAGRNIMPATLAATAYLAARNLTCAGRRGRRAWAWGLGRLRPAGCWQHVIEPAARAAQSAPRPLRLARCASPAAPRTHHHPSPNATCARRHGCSLQEVAAGFGVRPLDVGRHYL